MAPSDSENTFRTASSGYSDWEYESASTFNDGNMPQLQPYMFDPRKAVVEKELACAEDSEDDDDRFANLDWHIKYDRICMIMSKGVFQFL